MSAIRACISINLKYDTGFKILKKSGRKIAIWSWYNIDNEINHNNKTLKLKCSDLYEGLSEKVCTMYDFLYKNFFFKKYSHFFKLDSEIEIISPLDLNYLKQIEIINQTIGCAHIHTETHT